MGYYFLTTIDDSFAEALSRVRDALQMEGFGVISEIDIAKTLRDKIGVHFRPYVILGACNPALAHEALQLEDKIGTMLPCNVVVQQTPSGIEVAAFDPVASMKAIENDQLSERAAIVASKLRRVVERLGGKLQTDAEGHRQEVDRQAELSRRELESFTPHGTDPLHEGP